MNDRIIAEARELVAAVRTTAAAHRISWEALVPDAYRINTDAEHAEEAAYAEMAEANRRLRDHICSTYGITTQELRSLAAP